MILCVNYFVDFEINDKSLHSKNDFERNSVQMTSNCKYKYLV